MIPVIRFSSLASLCGLVLWLLAGTASAFEPMSALALTDEERAWLTENPVIQVGADQNWPPFDFVDESGTHHGIAADYLDLLEKMLEVKFEVSGEVWQDAMDGVKSGRFDMLACASITPERQEFLDFTAPYVDIDTVFVTNQMQIPVTRLEELAGKKVAVPRGTYIYELLTQLPFDLDLHHVESNEAALLALSLNQADVYVGNLAVVSYFIEKELLANLRIDARLEGDKYQLSMAVRKDRPLLRNVLDKALAIIPADTHREIRRRWVQMEAPVARNPSEDLTPAEKAWLREKGTIRVGVDPDWPPIEYFNDQGEYQGIASDYVAYFEEQLGTKFSVADNLSWADVIEAIKRGELDILPAVSRTPEREKYLDFTRPYLQFPYVIFNRQDAPLITGMEELYDKLVVVEKNYANHDLLEQHHPEIELLLVEGTEAAVRAVSLGQADAYVGNLAATSHILLQTGIANVKVAAPTPYSNDLAVGIRKGMPELVAVIQKALDNVTPQQANSYKERWFSIRYEHGLTYDIIWRILGIAAVIIGVLFLWLWWLRRQQEKLRVSEERFMLATAAADEGIWDWDVVDNTINYSGHYLEMLGYNANDFDDPMAIWVELLHPDDRKDAIAHAKREIRKYQSSYTHEFRMRHKNGSYREIQSTATVVNRDRDGNPLRVVGVHLDVTRQKKAEQTLLENQRLAEEANEFKSRFLANMSHEIRTPLNAISGMTYLALKTELTDKQRYYLETIRNSSASLIDIINDILDFSKIEAGRIELENIAFDLDEIFTRLSDVFRNLAEEKGLQLHFRMAPNVPQKLTGDPLRLSQVLTNLISNAIKFTKHGVIIVEVEYVIESHKQIELRFNVTDTGIGIPAEVIGDLFEAFKQADNTTTRLHGGTGLGLAISKELVDMMSGHLRVESTPGKGSRFYFNAVFGLEEGAQRGYVLPSPYHDKPRVLLIADDEVMRKTVADMLMSFTFQVSSMDEQLHDAKATTQDCPLLVVDIATHGQNAIELIDRLAVRYRESSLQILVLVSSRLFEKLSDAQVTRPNMEFLLKPFSPSSLFNAVVHVLRLSHEVPDQDTAPALDTSVQLNGKVLLTEDNMINQDIARELLEQMGLRVETANNGAEAVDKVTASHYDLILMDIQMPVMDGLQAARKIREQRDQSQLPIIAMTANVLTSDQELSRLAGMNDHLNKPIDPVQLYRLLARYLPAATTTISDSANNAGAPVSQPTLPKALLESPLLNTEIGLQHAGNNSTLYMRLLNDFHSDHQTDPERMRAALKDQQPEVFRRLTHTLKGIAGTIGAARLADAALALEQQTDSGESLLDTTEFSRFLDEFGAIMAVIAGLENRPGPAPVDTDGSDNGLEERLLDALTNGNAEAIELFQRYRHQSGHVDTEALAVMADCMHRFDFEAARVQLEAMRHQASQL